MSIMRTLTPVTFLAKSNGFFDFDLRKIDLKNTDLNTMMLDAFRNMMAIHDANLYRNGKIYTDCTNHHKIDVDLEALTTISIRTMAQEIANYVFINVQDLAISTALAATDVIKGYFNYDDEVKFEDHYEFEFPFRMYMNDNVNLFDDIVYGEFMSEIADTIIELENDISKHNMITDIDDDFIQYLYNTKYRTITEILVGAVMNEIVVQYFDKIIVETARFYISKPAIAKKFYECFTDEGYANGNQYGMNNTYVTITTILRELYTKYIGTFMKGGYDIAYNCIFLISMAAVCYCYHSSDFSEDYSIMKKLIDLNVLFDMEEEDEESGEEETGTGD